MSGILKRGSSSEEDGSHWLSVADLMAGLMMVFLFLAVTLMRYALIERDRVKDIAVAYQENQVAIYHALQSEFKTDLASWGAEIERDTLTFTFYSPDVLFDRGSGLLKDKYKIILDNFFPRYLAVLSPYKASIDEIRIEGHTSSRWNTGTSDTDAYFRNMNLSQERTRSVLRWIYTQPKIKEHKEWMKSHMAAVGLSSAKLIKTDKGEEDLDRSRRVSFRVITKADIKIKQILDS